MRPPRSRAGLPGPVPGTAAASLLAEAAAAPERRLVAGITGPGGTGKSTLLDRLADRYSVAGLPVAAHPSALPGRPGRAALLVDDAHLLADDALRDLHSAVARPELDLVVAYRLWPERPGIRRLAAALDHHHVPIVLGALTLREISATAAELWGDPPAPATSEEIRRLTGGQPWLVSRLLAAVPRPTGRALAVPHELLDQLGYELEGVEPALHELLVALAVGFDLSGPLPPALAHVGDRVDELVTRARHDGLVLGDGGLAPVVREALLENTPAYRLRTLQKALVEAYAAEGRALEPLAESLARAGLRDRRVASALEHSADHLLPTQPAVASVLYGEARDAGAAELPLAARRAQAEWAAGHSEAAWRILEEYFETEDPPDAVRAVNTAAALWAERGMLARAADTYRWLGVHRLGSSAPLAAVALIGAGELPPETPSPPASPALHAAAAALLERGLRASLSATAPDALASLVRASDMMTASGHAEPLPEVPAVVAALVALSGGDLAAAESVLDSAISGRQGGEGARPRLLLLRAWAAMQSDRPDRAAEAIAEATSAERGIRQRDELLLRALEVGLARRTDDLTALVRSWERARETVLHLPVDLFTLLPLGELMVAAARLRDSSRLEGHLADAWALLGRLGDPPLWSVPLHWSAVQAAILAENPAALPPHAAALARAAEHSRPAALLAAAGKTWVAVLAGRVDAASVESAARGLARIGLRWDGSRLAGHAAVRAEERRDLARLLACARELHPGPSTTTGPIDTVGSSRLRSDAGTAALSPREREIARLVLDGKNYREIGEAIFISPRTVEHHIARIRQRLDATSRSELLTRLRLILEADDTASD